MAALTGEDNSKKLLGRQTSIITSSIMVLGNIAYGFRLCLVTSLGISCFLMSYPFWESAMVLSQEVHGTFILKKSIHNHMTWMPTRTTVISRIFSLNLAPNKMCCVNLVDLVWYVRSRGPDTAATGWQRREYNCVTLVCIKSVCLLAWGGATPNIHRTSSVPVLPVCYPLDVVFITICSRLSTWDVSFSFYHYAWVLNFSS